MPPTGQLRVSLRCDAAGREAPIARLHPPTPMPLERVFVGQPPEAAALRAGLAFNICGAAQTGAARAALGLPPLPDAGRRILIETLRDHALTLGAQWPAVLGLGSDPALLAAVPALARGDGAPMAAALFGPMGHLPAGLEGFLGWLGGGSAPARVLSEVWHVWDATLADVVLPRWVPADGVAGLDIAAALWRGAAVETGLPALHADHPLLRAIAQARGHGLVWRLAARLVDADAALAALAGRVPAPAPQVLGPGLGAARAARGTMLVSAAVADGRVTRFARMSPTDAAVRPGGLMARALATLRADAGSRIETIARLVVEAVDPCLPVTVELVETAVEQEDCGHVHGLRLLG